MENKQGEPKDCSSTALSQCPVPHGVFVSAYQSALLSFQGLLPQYLNLHGTRRGGGGLQLQVTHDLAIPIAKEPSLSFPHSPKRSLSDLIHLFELGHVMPAFTQSAVTTGCCG